MAKPTVGAVTGAGFTQSGTTTLYTKVQGTAIAHADVGTGECSIQAAVPGTAMAAADLNAHLATFAQLGVFNGVLGRDVPTTAAGGLIYFGLST